jgi:hypothetical protein
LAGSGCAKCPAEPVWLSTVAAAKETFEAIPSESAALEMGGGAVSVGAADSTIPAGGGVR